MSGLRPISSGDFVFGLAAAKIARITGVFQIDRNVFRVVYKLLPDHFDREASLNSKQMGNLKLVRKDFTLARFKNEELGALADGSRRDVETLTAIARILLERRVTRTAADVLQRVEAYLAVLGPAPPTSSTGKTHISDMSDKVLIARWQNALAMLADPAKVAKHGEAELRLEQIGEEWAKRVSKAQSKLFAWPTTDAPGGNGSLRTVAAPERGMLGYLGYRVGISGIRCESERAIVLDQVFKHQLPPLESAEYMASWGEPGSAKRLQKIAESLAAFARNAKRSPYGSELAVEHWEEDLAYLYQKHYQPMRDRWFSWPSA